MNPELDFFTFSDKFNLISIGVSILVFNVGLFVWFESLNEVNKFQINTKKTIWIYISIITILLMLSFIFIAVPFIEHKTMQSKNVLSEVLIDNEKHIVVQKAIEGTYYPTFNGTAISWYTQNIEDQRYLQSEKVIEIITINQNNQPVELYMLNNSRIVSIVGGAIEPVKYRGTEAQSYWYSIIFVSYNILIAIFAYPLFSVYTKYIKLLWKSQNIISTIILAITISYAFMF